MNSKVTELTICLGSSCFARGNKGAVALIQEYLTEHQLESRVRFKGNHCFNKCNKGPVLQINGKLFEGVTMDTLPSILDREFGKIIGEKI